MITLCGFGGVVSEETKREAHERLTIGLRGVAQLSHFSAYIFGATFTAADCVAYVHFVMIALATKKIYGENMLHRFFPNIGEYMWLMDSRQHVKKVMADREIATTVFVGLHVKYDG